MREINLADDGMAKVNITHEGRVHSETIDLFDVHCRISDLARQPETRESTKAWYEGCARIMTDIGLPEVSLATVKDFVDAVTQAVADRKKSSEGEQKPDSPDSTAPQS